MCVCVCARARTSSGSRGFAWRRMEMGCDVYTEVINIKAVITPSYPSHFSLSLSTFPPLRSPRIPAGQAPEGQEPSPRQGCGAPWWSNCRRRASQTALCVQVSERSCEAALSVAGYLSSLPSAEGFTPPRPLCP